MKQQRRRYVDGRLVAATKRRRDGLEVDRNLVIARLSGMLASLDQVAALRLLIEANTAAAVQADDVVGGARDVPASDDAGPDDADKLKTGGTLGAAPERETGHPQTLRTP